MNLLFRHTLTNSIAGSLLIHEPEGWDEGILKLERNDIYHSLVEYFVQPLTFDDVTGNGLPGGLSYIRNIEATQGPDAQITLTIEISEDDGDTYENCFVGVLDFDTIKEIDFYKLQCGVKRDDFWSKFMNRKSIPVDLESTVDMDGNARDAVSGFTLPLPSQFLRKYFDGSIAFGNAFRDNTITATDYIQVDFDNRVVSEIDTKYTLPVSISDTLPVSILDIAEDGDYTFECRLEFSLGIETAGPPSCLPLVTFDPISTYMDVYIQKNDEAAILFTATDHGGESSSYFYTGLFNLLVGDQIRIYAQFLNDGWKTGNVDNIFVWGDDNSATFTPSGSYSYNGVDCDLDSVGFATYDFSSIPSTAKPSYLTITANTTFTETNTDAYTLGDAAESIISKLVGDDDVVLSDYLTGCGEEFAVMKGLHVRGYSFTDKPFAMTFDDWWGGANPIFNLGLGYESGNKIRIEQKSFFYDKTSTSFDFDFVNNIERSYSMDHIFKSIEIGYQKWSAESASGVDDPQSKRTWRTRFATVGKDEKILSQFIAASLAIEQTRRNRVELGKDWRLDDDIIIIATYAGEPEFDENFTSITNLLNEDARYNVRLSCGHNFQRWKNYFNGCLQIPGTDEFIFASGEGNYDMTSQLESADCEGTTPETNVNEKGNVAVTDDFLFMPVMYEFEHPLTYQQYKTIRDNPTKAIGVSRSNSGHKACFIVNLDYQVTRGLGTFTVILGENDLL